MALEIKILGNEWRDFLDEIESLGVPEESRIKTVPGRVDAMWNYNNSSVFPLAQLVANHVAFRVRNLEESSRIWSNILNSNPIISRNQFDPVSQYESNSDHFYKLGQFYITLIEDPTAICGHTLDHFGYEVIDLDTLNKCRDIIQKHNYPIIWEGVIDSSNVIHFRGPDGVIHDFFVTADNLRNQS